MTISEETKAIRIQKALEVLAELTANPRMTQKKACEKVGMDPGTYRYWISQSHEAIDAFRETIQEVERVEMSHILVARESIVQKLISDGLARNTDPIARLAITRYLDDRLDTLAERHRSSNTGDMEEFLIGPTLQKGKNRFGMGSLEITEADDGSVNIKAKPHQVIDAEILERQPNNEPGSQESPLLPSGLPGEDQDPP